MLHNYLFLKENLIFRIVLTTVAKLSYKLGWRVTLSGTALDALYCYFTNSDNNLFMRSRTLDFFESGCLIRKLSGSINAFLLTSSIID